ncbi:MAG: C-GCAxxG-C-C family protein [Candidatus Heimdallarchaeota archaeon]
MGEKTFPEFAEELAHMHMKQYNACTQVMVLTFQELLGLENDQVLKAATGLVGGISRMKSVCGAVSGGAMALSLKYGRGRDDLDKVEAMYYAYKPVQQFFKKFEDEFGSTNCFEIIGVDLKEANARQKWIEAGGLEKCAELVGKAAHMVAEVLQEEEKK